ncbi:MAG: hypothetical protein K2K32_05510 [Muribaculaceae bacterium]|nr:hypothetical protein [Muribaculaceae bacterium]
MTFGTPEGCDGLVIMAPYGETSEIELLKTRAEEDWMDLDYVTTYMGFNKANTVTFACDGDDNFAYLGLVKGDKVYQSIISLSFNVSKAGGTTDDEPLLPESINVTTFVDGLIVDQERDSDDGSIYIDITGTITQSEYTLVLDVPEGWDGFVSMPWFGADVTIEESGTGPRKIAATDHDWVSLDYFLGEGYVKGNKLTFKPTNDWEYVFTYLYKGDKVDYNTYIGFAAKVDRVLCKVTTSIEDLDVTTEEYDGVISVEVNGASTEDEYTVTIETLDGYDGFLVYTDSDLNPEVEPAKKALDPEWISVSEMLEEGLKMSNSVTFPINDEEHWGQFIPYKGDMADVNNFINIDSYVTKLALPTEIGVNVSNSNLTVEQAWNQDEERHKIAITGETSAETYTVDLDVPEGWTGFMAIAHDDAAVSMRKKAASASGYDWVPVSEFEEMGYVSANNFTITTGEEKQYIDLFLYKDDQVDYNAYIQLMSDVARVESTDPEFPRELDITASASGVEITEYIDWSCFTVGINGESATPTFDVEINVPAGWDGFVIYPWSDNVKANESLINPRKAPKAIDETWEPYEFEWRSIDEYLAAGYVKGNSFTVTANGSGIDAIAYLYKDGQVETANAIYFEGSVTCSGGTTIPTFPENFDVTTDSWDVEIWQGGPEDISISGVELSEDEQMIIGMMYPQYAIVFTGETENATLTANFDLPAGWAGILPIKINFTPYTEENDLTTRAYESEFAPLDEFKQSFMGMTGMFDVNAIESGNPLVFPANGERQLYISYLYLTDDGTLTGDPEFAGDFVDAVNSFLIVVDVKSKGNAVESINAIDTDADYYDVNGNKIANPSKGIYVKVKDGKASKVVVK